MIDLPSNWAWATLEELSIVERGITFPKEAKTNFPKEDYVICLRTTNVQKYVDWDDLIFVPIEYVTNEAKWLMPEDILISMANSRELVGKTSFVYEVREKTTFGGFISTIRSRKEILSKYLFYYLKDSETQEWLRSASSHTVNIANLSLARINPLPIPLAPLPEQRRIIAKLDALFARNRQAREELENIPTLIEHYKQAILAAAFRGELTADWRAKHQPPQVHANISGIDGRTGQLPGIPDVWGWASIDSISQVSGGLTKNAQRRELKQKVPYLRVANVYANELRLDEVKEIGCTDSELAKTQLQQGDLLVVEGNGSIEQIGRVAIWDGSITPCSHQNHIIRVRPNEQVISPYILFWMISPLGRQYIERVASSSSGLHTLSISKVSGLAIPVCSIDEQEEVVRHIEEAFTWLDTVLDEATNAMRLFDHLEQATLAKAFRGELVPQDPNDEPASILLESLREARAEQTNGSQRKKRK